MPTFNFFYNKTPITKDSFEYKVSKNWAESITFGEYTYGNYRVVQIG